MMKISRPIIVEGKYDRLKILTVAEAKVITTDGFGIFSKAEKAEFLRRLAEKNGVIVITDCDGAGLIIRNHLKNIIPRDKIIHIYTPEIKGKEKRKKTPSKAGYLGLEGMSAEWLEKALAPYADGAEAKAENEKRLSASERRKTITLLYTKMNEAAKKLDFELAAILRDKIRALEQEKQN